MFILDKALAETMFATSPARAMYLRSRNREKRVIAVSKMMVMVVFFLSWELAARFRLIDPFIFSQPTRMFSTIVRLFRTGELFHHIAVTTLEAVAGFVIGTALGTLIAILFWWKKILYQVAEPYLVILNALPKIALGPIFIVWLGAGSTSIVVITLTISIVVSVLEILSGFLATDREKIRLVATFGATKLQTLTKVVLPANLGTIINSLKINVGMSWVGVIVGEFLVSKAGLGYLIVYGSQVFQLDLVMASVLILATIATLMYLAVVWFERFIKRVALRQN